MQLMPKTIKAIIKDGLDRFPQEACGYIVQTNKKEEVIPLANLAGESYGESMFMMDTTSMQKIRKKSTIIAIYHTHPHSSPAPSLEDRVGCKKSGVPWVIVSPKSGEMQYITPSEDAYKVPLLGRDFAWGIFDCYSLLQDYYKETFLIDLPDFDRGLLFEWDNSDWNKFEENFSKAGFQEISLDDQLIQGDVFLMNIGSTKINHCGFLVSPDKNIFYHHLLDRKSESAVYGGWFEQVTRKVVRHKKILKNHPSGGKRDRRRGRDISLRVAS